MGSLISLGLGRLELDWGKNSFFMNHSTLFLPNDIRQVPYFYAEGVVESKRAYARSLHSVVRRLEMLGFTLHDCERHYRDPASSVPSSNADPFLTYEQFAKVLKGVNVNAIELPEEGVYDFGEYVTRAIMCDPEFTRTNEQLGNLSSDAGEFFENLHPYITLRLLGENDQNLNEDVIWRFADIVEGGYFEEDGLYEGVSEADSCLVVTEGSSDASILRASLPIVAPDLVDFFDFIDMWKNYPFSGTGNLFRFCQGLSRIRIQNRILVVLDNDTAGREAYRRIGALDLPSRMSVALLPELDDCRAVQTLGPSGSQEEDINGRAVSVECFLDIWSHDEHGPTVRWTSYNVGLDAYQGELLEKESYTRRFLEAAKRGTRSYDYRRLTLLWDHLVAVCTGECAILS